MHNVNTKEGSNKVKGNCPFFFWKMGFGTLRMGFGWKLLDLCKIRVGKWV